MPLNPTLDVSIDTAVGFAFTVTNTGSDSVDLDICSGLAADFAVYKNDTEVWRWSDGRMFTQALESVTLPPGEAVTYTGRWTDPRPGTWTAVATLEAVNVSIDATAEFVV